MAAIKFPNINMMSFREVTKREDLLGIHYNGNMEIIIDKEALNYPQLKIEIDRLMAEEEFFQKIAFKSMGNKFKILLE